MSRSLEQLLSDAMYLPRKAPLLVTPEEYAIARAYALECCTVPDGSCVDELTIGSHPVKVTIGVSYEWTEICRDHESLPPIVLRGGVSCRDMIDTEYVLQHDADQIGNPRHEPSRILYSLRHRRAGRSGSS